MDQAFKEPGRRVSRDEVFEAAEALLSQGSKPTLEAVRRHLLSTSGRGGSFVDISPFMKEWRQGRLSKVTSFHPEVPEILRDRYTAAMSDVWTVAMELASSEFSSRQSAFETQMKECEAEKDEALEAAESLRLDLIQQREHEGKLSAELDEAAAMKRGLQEELHTTVDSLHKTEAALAELRERLSHLDRLYSTERKRSDELTKQLAKAEAVTQSCTDRLAQADSSAASERANAHAAQLEVARLHERLQLAETYAKQSKPSKPSA